MSFPTLQSLFEAKSAGFSAELIDALNSKANGADEVEYKGKTYRRSGPKNSTSQPGKWKEVLAVAPTSDLTPDDVIEKAVEAMMVRHARVHTLEPDGDEGLLVEVVYEFPEHRNGLNQAVRKVLGKHGKVDVQKMTPYHGEYVSAFNIELNKPVKNMAKLVKALRAKYP